MLKYPIGIQNFESLITGGYVYVDKTIFIEKLLNTSKFIFLSRPRRFGKSLFLNTLKYYFSGRKDLFSGLYIENKLDFEARPVIHLDFSSEAWKEIGLRNHMLNLLDEHASIQNVTFTKNSLAERFKELITSIPQNPVILIDEYDKPILHFIGIDDEQANENRKIMQEFYSILKPLDANIHFLFITGITRFSKTSLFSDLNHLMDITLNSHFSGICGYTQNELESNFKEAISEGALLTQKTESAFKEEIKRWYNGYKWDVNKDSVYNPFSIINFFADNGNFKNYWFESGLPTFLINTINKNEDYDFEEVMADPLQLSNFSIKGLNSITLLFQAGYLTLKESDPTYVVLEYPNFEVKRSLLSSIILDKAHDDNAPIVVLKLRNYFENRQEKEIRKTFEALFAKIPNQIFNEKYEFYYHSILVVAMQLLGCYIDAEVSVNDGRIDAVVKTKNYIYIIEFKVDQSAGIALEQIKEKEYYNSYKNDDRQLLLMGVNFMDKKVESFEIEEV